MLSLFDRIPYETLSRIVEYHKDSAPDLRQFRLVNKQWQSVAEKFIYQKLDLTGYDNSRYKLRFYELLVGPRYAKQVAELIIDTTAMFFRDSFFDTFSNITTVSCVGDIDWSHFRETFSPKRCRLKYINISKIACWSIFEDEHYHSTIADHAQTLSKLQIVLTRETGINFTKLPLFPNMEALSIEELGSNFSDICEFINKCPKLQQLSVHGQVAAFSRTIHSPGEQYQQRMTCVCARFASTKLSVLCGYFTVKFPTVDSWKLTTYEPKDFGHIDTFDDIKEYLPLVSKAKQVELEYYGFCTSIPDVLEALTTPGQVKCWFVTVEYRHVSRGYFVDSRHYSPHIPNNIYIHSSAAKIRILYSGQQVSPINTVKIVYADDKLHHFDLVDRASHLIKELRIKIPGKQKVITEVVLDG